MSGIHSAGISNNLIYDNCSYQQYLESINDHYHYRLYQGAYENINKCRKDNFYHPYDLVDVESDLKNTTRPASNCRMFKYNPSNKGKCQTVKKPYEVSSIQCNRFISEKQSIPQIKEQEKNEGLLESIKKTAGIENFTEQQIQRLYYDGYETKPRANLPIVNQTTCPLDGSLSTFSETAPVVYPPELCPIVHNNIPKRKCNGIVMPKYIQ